MTSPATLSLPFLLPLLLLVHGPPATTALAGGDLRFISFRVSEGLPTGSFVGDLTKVSVVRKLLGRDRLEGARFDLFPSELGPMLFHVDAATGVVSTTSPLDREQICRRRTVDCEVTLHVQLYAPVPAGSKKGSGARPPESTILKVRVVIEDKNDNAPEFSNPKVELQVPESSKVGSVFGLPPARDADTPANAVVEYTMNDTDGVFGLVVKKQAPLLPSNGHGNDVAPALVPMLQQKRALDRERQAVYRYTLWARDKDGRQGSLQVRVALVDVNDNAPKWEKAPYSVTMRECKPLGEALLAVRATDADEGQFGRVRYAIASSASAQVAQMFYMNGNELFANENPDFEKDRRLVVPLVAEDGGRLQTPNEVRIEVLDCNDHRPNIAVRSRGRRPGLGGRLGDGANPSIRENEREARVVATLLVEDKDAGENGRTACQIDARAHFELKEQTGADARPQVYDLLTLPNTEYDREAHPRFRVTVTCQDFGVEPLSNSRSLLVEVEDENDNAPAFRKPVIHLRVFENNHIGDYVGSVLASDPDAGQNGVVSYALEPSEAALAFKIDTQGNLRALRRFDREARDAYRFRVVARDNGSPQRLNATAAVVVRVLDVNDNAPRFHGDYRFEVTEARGGQRLASVLLGRLNASDPDEGPNGTLRYSLAEFIPAHCRHCFTVASDGALRVSGHIDRERVAQFRFKALAVDQGYPVPKTGSAWVLVTVRDLNDNKPRFLFPSQRNNTVLLAADTPVGHQVAQLAAEDPDEGRHKEVLFRFPTPHRSFQLETDGRLILNRELDPAGPGAGLAKRLREHKLVIRAENPDDPNMVSVGILNVVVQRRRRRPWGADRTGAGADGAPDGYLTNPRGGGGAGGGGGSGAGPSEGGHRGRGGGTSRNNSLLLLILTAASVVVFILVVTIFALVYLRKIPCQGSGASKRRRRPPGEEEKPGSAGGRQEELYPIQARPGGMEIDGKADPDSVMAAKLGEKTLRKGPPPSYSSGEKGSAPSLLDRQTSGGNYAYIPAPTFESLDRHCGGDPSDPELTTGTGKLSRKCYRPAGAESHAYTELEVRDVLLPDLSKDSPSATYQNTLKQCSNSHWALNTSGTAQRTPVITSSFV